ncbi:hypothetical protein E0L36_23305 [Streptomyces sp. AJS327]|uniref:hypothetical protein n=1 Tax=Streptomyces sp. AJS327 TaxID=2545265 RepID=UPI0015E01714|nr:hypothetical protein [Streptomyces sp. AJS327]MBA0053684.1 hypothetical protein [Streptomyces sp. AJS327]
MARFLLFLIRVQWIDRIATSSFLIGITVQTGLLTTALHQRAGDAGEAVLLATRASMLTCTTIVLLSAMSNVQNEFRYGTVERILLGRVPFARVLGIRSGASAIVASPAIVVPYAGAALRFPELLAPHTVLLVAMVYVCLGTLCYQATLVLCQLRNAALAVPWLRMFLLFVGLSVIPFEGSERLSLLLPTGWLVRFAADGGSDTSAYLTFLAFVAVCAAWTVGVWLLLRQRALRVVERNLTDGPDRP